MFRPASVNVTCAAVSAALRPFEFPQGKQAQGDPEQSRGAAPETRLAASHAMQVMRLTTTSGLLFLKRAS